MRFSAGFRTVHYQNVHISTFGFRRLVNNKTIIKDNGEYSLKITIVNDTVIFVTDANKRDFGFPRRLRKLFVEIVSNFKKSFRILIRTKFSKNTLVLSYVI